MKPKNVAGEKTYPIKTREGFVTAGWLAKHYNRHVTRIYRWLRDADEAGMPIPWKRFPGDRLVFYDLKAVRRYLVTPKETSQ